MNYEEASAIRDVRNLYYNGPGTGGSIFESTFWIGVPCLKCLLESSSEQATIDAALSCEKGARRVLLNLDSGHSEPHVTWELELLSPHVSAGSYVIVGDKNINGHPRYTTFGPGPFETVQKFLDANPSFVVDASREKFLMTFNPKGLLKRIRWGLFTLFAARQR